MFAGSGLWAFVTTPCFGRFGGKVKVGNQKDEKGIYAISYIYI